MIIHHEDVEKQKVAEGIMMQHLGPGKTMNTLHWNLDDKSEIPMHSHPQEQFGYVIRGGFKFFIGDETHILKAGDSYYVPPNVEHGFITQGDTEAIDVFHPIKEEIPQKID